MGPEKAAFVSRGFLTAESPALLVSVENEKVSESERLKPYQNRALKLTFAEEFFAMGGCLAGKESAIANNAGK